MIKCERKIATVVKTPKGGFVAMGNIPCPEIASRTREVTIPVKADKVEAFEVDLCIKHYEEAEYREPLDTDLYVYCGDCKSYADRCTGRCGCL